MNSSEILRLIWPVIVIQLALQIYAIVDIAKKRQTKNLSVPVWLIIIIFGEIVGAILYLILGRKEE